MMHYPPLVVPIVACPFCREMFEKAEAKSCPVCGIALEAFESLPASPHVLAELGEDGVPFAPENERFRASYVGRGRGALVAIALVGLALFFLPWIRLTVPYIDSLSGFDLAHRIGWPWAAGVAWGVIVPTVGSRRTIAELRGARVAAGFLAAVPGLTAAILITFRPPHGLVPIRFTYAWPMGATVLFSLLAVVLSVRLGGRVDDMAVDRGRSIGQPLH
jgi:hypothetical protein